jgi:branched-chain amino acid aminotransferase
VSVLDRGYLLGDGVFTTMRGYNGVCFRAMTHLEEIEKGAALFGFDVPMKLTQIAELANEAAKRTQASNAYVRVTLTHGATDDLPPQLSIIARPMTDLPTDAEYASGIDAITVTPRRIPPACIDGSIKTTSYAVQVLARNEVRARGAFEGIQRTIDGDVACGTMSTLFAVFGDNDELHTPPLSTGCRDGVTRKTVLELAPSLNLKVKEDAAITLESLLSAQEVFFASTRVECLAVKTIDGQKVGVGDAFPKTHAIHQAFRQRVGMQQ